ncbi:uncharacterized protein LOC123540052 [Mercenaria mercenaria]|uniref:uncharacterized protein LOC123540052 n=1 Tax=Mercenaria mercenaria TaxID=6596 RepID=UPI00234F799E|nr:uncharacterized protein LOC123540052 [Mercenaria mercenaria]
MGKEIELEGLYAHCDPNAEKLFCHVNMFVRFGTTLNQSASNNSPVLWAIFLEMHVLTHEYLKANKPSISEEIKPILHATDQKNKKYLQNTCKQFGINSEEVEELTKDICKDIKAGSDNILRVWPAYRENNRTDIVFVVITDTSLDSPKDIDYVYDFEIVLRADGDTNEENRIVIEHEVESDNYISDTRSEEMRNVINGNSDTLGKQHSNITMISASSMKSFGYLTNNHKMEREDCITLFVHVKGLIPIKEKCFPKTLGGFNVDIREDVFQVYTSRKPNEWHKDLKMGCRIGLQGVNGYGTLGGIIEHPHHGICFITCAHVLLNVEELQMNKTPPITCYQPSFDKEAASNHFRCGELKDHKIGEVVGREAGVDAALVKIDESRKPVNGIFPEISSDDVKLSGFDADCTLRYTSGMVYDTEPFLRQKDKHIVKYGATTLLKQGRFGFYGAKTMVFGHFLLSNQFQIYNMEKPFALPGDSGSLVFSVSDNGLVAIGLLAGGSKGYAIVTPICDILHAIGCSPPYSLKAFQEVDDRIDDTEINHKGSL